MSPSFPFQEATYVNHVLECIREVTKAWQWIRGDVLARVRGRAFLENGMVCCFVSV